MSAMLNGREYRLEPEQVPGTGWMAVLATGNRKKGTRITVPVSDPVYTLAQAQAFVSNNRTADFLDLIK